MRDTALVFDQFAQRFDYAIEGAGLKEDEGLETSVFLSLSIDAPATDEQLVEYFGGSATQLDNRGWWGDVFNETQGRITGSLLWLLQRRALTANILPDSKSFCDLALDWMLIDKIADSVTVLSELLCDDDGIAFGVSNSITIKRPGQAPRHFLYPQFWENVKNG